MAKVPADVHRSARMHCGRQTVTGQILFLLYPGVPLKHDPAFRGPIRGKSRLVAAVLLTHPGRFFPGNS